MHRPYLSLTTSRFVVRTSSINLRQPSYQIFTYKFDIQERHVSQSQGGGGGGGGGEFNRPFQGWGITCRFGARSECGQRVRSINRIAPQGSHRYSRRGTTPLCYTPLCYTQCSGWGHRKLSKYLGYRFHAETWLSIGFEKRETVDTCARVQACDTVTVPPRCEAFVKGQVQG